MMMGGLRSWQAFVSFTLQYLQCLACHTIAINVLGVKADTICASVTENTSVTRIMKNE